MALNDGLDGKGSLWEYFEDGDVLSSDRLMNLNKQPRWDLEQLLLTGHANAPGQSVITGLGVTANGTGLAVDIAPGVAIRGQSPLGGGPGALPPTICRMEDTATITLTADANNDQWFLVYAAEQDVNQSANIQVRNASTGVVSIESRVVRVLHGLYVADPGDLVQHTGPYSTEADALAAITDDDIPLAVVKVAAGGSGPGDLTIYDYRMPFVLGGLVFRLRFDLVTDSNGDFQSFSLVQQIHNAPNEFIGLFTAADSGTHTAGQNSYQCKIRSPLALLLGSSMDFENPSEIPYDGHDVVFPETSGFSVGTDKLLSLEMYRHTMDTSNGQYQAAELTTASITESYWLTGMIRRA